MTETRRNSESTKIAYDIVAESYAELLRDELTGKPLDRALLGMFAELVLNAGGRAVADLGCGPGRIADHLHSLGVDVFGIDLSPKMIAVARRSYPRVQFTEGPMESLTIANGVLGGIVAWYSIIHTPPLRLPGVFDEFFRVLGADGQLLLAFQVGDGSVHHIERGYGHQISLDAYRLQPDEIAAMLLDAGFAVDAKLVREPMPPEKPKQAYLIAHKE